MSHVRKEVSRKYLRAVDGNRFKNEIATQCVRRKRRRSATVFLDEIDELDQNCQRTLLSALMHAENSDEDSETRRD